MVRKKKTSLKAGGNFLRKEGRFPSKWRRENGRKTVVQGLQETKVKASRRRVSTTKVERRLLRSKYLQVVNKISVRKPRGQVADAYALLDITNALVTSVKSQSNHGISIADFITCLITDFGKCGMTLVSRENELISFNWQGIGLQVSPILRMLGPMNTEVMQRKPAVHRKCAARPTQTAWLEELNNAGADEETDTNRNMAKMSEVLRRKGVKLENLILNRNSFAQWRIYLLCHSESKMDELK
ncbi:hypothetical protein SLEP1_g23700 [Rubroshorea leprosula]|uniref:Non-structural maintenance of chromosomes element 4 n=1 Tax=Rubroshorea leprosula TaxID=152421 RepID=A0AAV5JKG9_9ROSI|nr:hypothetical protein SLEP1_g23700 [Rubroshorea leprosula]